MVDFRNTTTIINFVELVLSIIIGGLWAKLVGPDISRSQLIDVVVYGYIIVSILLCLAAVLGETIGKNVRLVIAGSGFVMYLTAGALLLDIYTSIYKNTEYSNRVVSAGVFSLMTACTYIADAYFVYTGKS